MQRAPEKRQLEALVIAKGMCLPILPIYPPILSLFAGVAET